MNTYYQFNVHNSHVNFLVTVPELCNELAEKHARDVAINKYGLDEEKVKHLKSNFFLSFKHDSVVDLNTLSSEEDMLHYADLLEDEIIPDEEPGVSLFGLLYDAAKLQPGTYLATLSIVATLLAFYFVLDFPN